MAGTPLPVDFLVAYVLMGIGDCLGLFSPTVKLAQACPLLYLLHLTLFLNLFSFVRATFDTAVSLLFRFLNACCSAHLLSVLGMIPSCGA